VLDRPEAWYEVLVVDADVQHPNSGAVLIPAGTPVIGRFEGTESANGRRFVSQVVIQGGDRDRLAAASEPITGARTANEEVLRNAGIGGAAVMVVSGFSGIGLLGGAALGAAATYATEPAVVTIQPGQVIAVTVVAPSDTAAGWPEGHSSF
jgi:hypothetical protein